ncbi:replication-associated protein [Sewage-associated circular DNA virus-25]|uniref:replication-associated protein n=1 Tax=Sewage-associated circular DNA virus-25 TaxID=1592092 RepID=UPI0005863FAE|nr:replication-associated protein [Sewage-associated circular DNA virus-25]AJD07544.1 replication-associated protein [Sewage-associated circular DNA virus-25]
MSSSSRWVFTVNNPGAWRPHYDVTAMQFLVFQMEQGASGTPHIQGYVRFTHPKKLEAAKRALVCEEAHMEIANGNEGQCIDYCTKEDTRIGGPWVYGTQKRDAGRKGSRSDLQAVAEAAQKPGVSMRQLAREFPAQVIKYSQQIERYMALVEDEVPIERDIFVHVIWGPTGTGKTHRVRHGIPQRDLYVVNGKGRGCFDQYAGQKALVLEEFEPNEWSINEVKTLLDKWTCPLNARYSNKTARWTQVFITSNSDPMSWYQLWLPADLAAFQRRLTRITHVLSREQEVELFPLPAVALPPPSPAVAPSPIAARIAARPCWSGAMDADLPQPDQVTSADPLRAAGTSNAPAIPTPRLPTTPTPDPLNVQDIDGIGAITAPAPVTRTTSVDLQAFFSNN